jgi:hypothetical protein
MGKNSQTSRRLWLKPAIDPRFQGFLIGIRLCSNAESAHYGTLSLLALRNGMLPFPQVLSEVAGTGPNFPLGLSSNPLLTLLPLPRRSSQAGSTGSKEGV